MTNRLDHAARGFLRAVHAALAERTPADVLAHDLAAVSSAAQQLVALQQPSSADAPVPHAEPAR